MLKICVLGLGYVGLPVALGISNKYKTIGFDISQKRIKELKVKFDANGEYKRTDFNRKKLFFSDKEKDLKDCNFYIICVPTPVNKNNLPDLSHIKKSIFIISKYIKSTTSNFC